VAIVWHLKDRSLHTAAVIDLPRASFMHDFTATARHLIFVLQPWVHDRQGMPYAARFSWKPEMGTQVMVVDKADLSRRRIYELPTFSYFHLGDAWEDASGTIRFDVAAGKDVAFAIDGARVLSNNALGAWRACRAEPHHSFTDGRAEMASRAHRRVSEERSRRAGLPRRLTVHVAGARTGPCPQVSPPRGQGASRFHLRRHPDQRPSSCRGPRDRRPLVAPRSTCEGIELYAFDAARVPTARRHRAPTYLCRPASTGLGR
jgi:hypothetical protein